MRSTLAAIQAAVAAGSPAGHRSSACSTKASASTALACTTSGRSGSRAEKATMSSCCAAGACSVSGMQMRDLVAVVGRRVVIGLVALRASGGCRSCRPVSRRRPAVQYFQRSGRCSPAGLPCGAHRSAIARPPAESAATTPSGPSGPARGKSPRSITSRNSVDNAGGRPKASTARIKANAPRGHFLAMAA
jgi:hypothetical protein